MDNATSVYMSQTTTTSAPDLEEDTVISDAATFYILLIVNVFINGIVSVVGIVTNCLNVAVFLRQGVFSEYGTAGIFGLALSDLMCVILTLWLSIGEALVLADMPNLSWNVFDVVDLTASWPRLMFSLVARCEAAYVCFERCICVVFPFKVKQWLTPKRSLLIMGILAIVVVGLFSPVYFMFQLEDVTDPATNLTIMQVVVDFDLKKVIDGSVRYIIAYGFHFVSLVIVFVCTLITSYRITLSKSWRESFNQSSESSSNKDTSAPSSASMSKMKKEERLVKMIITISIIFLICYVPYLIYMITITIDDNYSFRGKYQNFSRVMYAFIYLFETLNSSINIIVYYVLSSRFKEELNAILGIQKQK